MRTLGRRPLVVRPGAARVRIGDGGGPCPYGGVAGEGRTCAGGQVGSVGREFGGDRVGALRQALGEGDDLGRLLPCERQPAQDLRLDIPLGRGVERHMEQRAGGGHVDPLGETEQRAQCGEGLGEVVDPDVTAVDDTGDEPLAGETAHRGQVVQVGGRGLGEVEREPLHRRLGEDVQGLAEPVEVGGDQDLRPVGETPEVAVGAHGGVQFGGGAVLDESGLVQLHPLRARRAQVGEDLGVHRQQAVQEGQRFEVGRDTRGGLGEQEVGDRADEHRAGGEAQREGLLQLRDLLGGVGGEHGARAQLGHQIVVVGVEPLRHLQRRHVLRAARHREVPVQRVEFDGGAVAGGDRADHDAGVQDMVVVREVAGRHLVDAGVGQVLPVRAAQFGGGGPEGVGVDAALPVALDGLLQFPALALTGVAVHGRPCCRGCGLRCHGNLLREISPWIPVAGREREGS